MSKIYAVCAVDDCERRTYGHGWCNLHYQRWRRTGSPIITRTMKGRTRPYRIRFSVEERLLAKIAPIPTDANACQEWVASVDHHGYGQLAVRKNGHHTMAKAHRLVYEFHHGRSLKDNEFVLHRCDNPRCVRPEHLFIGDQAVNMRDCATKGRARNQYTVGGGRG